MRGWEPLCRLDELGDPGSRGFTLDLAGGFLDLFVVRSAGRVFGYRNSCPHTGATLEWQPDRFLDAEGEFIQCGLHGALFRVENGECVHGPCLGAFLSPLPLDAIDGEVGLVTA